MECSQDGFSYPRGLSREPSSNLAWEIRLSPRMQCRTLDIGRLRSARAKELDSQREFAPAHT
jgi:hypothetical protein